MNITKKRLGYGHYEIRRDGTLAGYATKIRDTGEPLWELTVTDGTSTDTHSGRRFHLDRFPTLACAISHYAYCAKLAA